MGRVRLVADDTQINLGWDSTAFEQILEAKLGKWFVSPIMTRHKPPKLFELIEESSGQSATQRPHFKLIEQLQSKQAWLPTDKIRPVWPMQGVETPPIVAFYSFLVARGTSQNIEGMKVTLTRMNAFGELSNRARLIQTFVDNEREAEEVEAFATALLLSFYGGEHAGREAEIMPPDDKAAPHEPLVLHYNAELSKGAALPRVWRGIGEDIKEQLTKISETIDTLTDRLTSADE
jgi:hypothetical protein